MAAFIVGSVPPVNIMGFIKTNGPRDFYVTSPLTTLLFPDAAKKTKARDAVLPDVHGDVFF